MFGNRVVLYLMFEHHYREIAFCMASANSHVSAGWWSGWQCLLPWVWLAAGLAVMFELGGGRAVSVCCHGFGWLLGLLSCFNWVMVGLSVFAVMGLGGCWACCHVSAGWWSGSQCLLSWVWLAAGFAVMFQLGGGRAVSVCCHGFGWLLGLLSWFSWGLVRLLVFGVIGLAGCWACCHISAGLWRGELAKFAVMVWLAAAFL